MRLIFNNSNQIYYKLTNFSGGVIAKNNNFVAEKIGG